MIQIKFDRVFSAQEHCFPLYLPFQAFQGHESGWMQQDDKSLGTGCMRVNAHYLDHWILFLGYSAWCADFLDDVPRFCDGFAAPDLRRTSAWPKVEQALCKIGVDLVDYITILHPESLPNYYKSACPYCTNEGVTHFVICDDGRAAQ